MQICQDHEDEFEKSIVQKIQDYNIFRNVRDLADQLRPIATAIDESQSDHRSIADACHVWITLLQNPVLAPHKAAVNKRFKQAITTEHLVAYHIHPRYQGEKLTPAQRIQVTEWMADRELLQPFISLQAQESPFPKTFFAESVRSMEPCTWWKATSSFGVSPQLITIANTLLSTPPSSASIERIFSNFGAIHTKIRNRLGNDKTSKLVFCYRMLRGNQELDY